MRFFDFSSWQSILSSIAALLLVTLIGMGIRLLMMMTIQQRRERQNRQINERLKALIAAYKVLGGSFTGTLSVDPSHMRDLRQALGPAPIAPPPEPAIAPASAPAFAPPLAPATAADPHGPGAPRPVDTHAAPLPAAAPSGAEPEAPATQPPPPQTEATEAQAIRADGTEPQAAAATRPPAIHAPVPSVGGSDRARRIRDAVEAALSDVVLFGTEAQVTLAATAMRDMVAGRPVHLHDLVAELRAHIRQTLDLAPIPATVRIPNQGPARPSASGSKGRDSGGSRGGGGGMGGGMGGGGMGMGGAAGDEAGTTTG